MGRTQASASRRMKLALLCCLLPCLVLSNPQITQNCAGSHCGQNNVGSPAGPIAQNCQGSACVQNNVGRRKREIVAEILAEAVEAVGRQERSAPPAGHGHDGGHQGHLPPGHVPNINIPDINIPDINIPDVNIPDIHIPDVQVNVPQPQHHQPQHQQPPQHHESPQHQESAYHKRSADPQHISQNCAGSQCNQNNLAAAAAGLGGGFTGFFPSIAQNCVGSACNQNNVLGRKKREVLAHLIEEARKIAEEEVEAEEAVSRRKREGPDADGCVVGPSGEEVCSHGSYGSDGESSVQARGNQGPGLTGSNGNAGPVSAAGLAYDPAAEAYRQQVLAYQAWAHQQVENAKGQLGTA